jgi:hypothetical protein
MDILAISMLVLLVFVLLTLSRPAKPQIVLVVEPPPRPNGCLILLVLAIITFLAVGR